MEEEAKPYSRKLVWSAVIIFVLALSMLEVYKKGDRLPETREDKKGETSAPLTVEVIPHVKIGGQDLKVDLAVTGGEKEQGLSGRTELLSSEGMLFVFEASGRHGFWMKDMNFPIDIIWLAPDGKVVDIKKNATPESYPELFLPSGDAQYVLEVVAGFSDKNNLKIGDSAEILY